MWSSHSTAWMGFCLVSASQVDVLPSHPSISTMWMVSPAVSGLTYRRIQNAVWQVGPHRRSRLVTQICNPCNLSLFPPRPLAFWSVSFFLHQTSTFSLQITPKRFCVYPIALPSVRTWFPMMLNSAASWELEWEVEKMISARWTTSSSQHPLPGRLVLGWHPATDFGWWAVGRMAQKLPWDPPTLPQPHWPPGSGEGVEQSPPHRPLGRPLWRRQPFMQTPEIQVDLLLKHHLAPSE